MLTFAQPLFLFALAGLALPLIAHLVNRSRAQPLRFPSVRFISASQIPRDEKRWLRDLLLLLMRLALLALINVALAGPSWTPQHDQPAVAASDERTMIVLDASASMSGWGAWEEAREAVSGLLEKGNGATGLVIFDSEVIAAMSPTKDLRTIKQVVGDVSPGERAGNPAPALDAALERLGTEGKRRLVLISDFQNSTWQGARWPAFGEDVALDFVQVGDFSQPNVAILDAQTFPASNGMIRVLARVRNDAETPQDVTVKLHSALGDVSQELSFAPEQAQAVDFLVEAPEELEGVLSIPDDAFTADNTYAVSLATPQPSQVVAILPGTEEPEKLEEVAFVRKALLATSDGQAPTFALSGAAPGFDLAAVAEAVDVLYLPGTLAYFDEPQLAEVLAYVVGGGVALITPGQNAPRQFRLMREYGLSETAFMGRPGRQGDRSEPYRIASLEPGNPLETVFSGESSRDLALAELYQYVKVRPSDSAEILLATEDGDPLLLRETLGNGTLLISTIGLDTSWSDLPLRNAYLPVLREILLQAIGEDTSLLKLAVGEPLPSNLAAAVGPDALLLTAEPGVSFLGNKTLQVNVSRDESVNDAVMLSDIRALLNRPAQTLAVAEEGGPVAVALWPWLAGAATLLLVGEMLLSTPRAAQRKVRHA